MLKYPCLVLDHDDTVVRTEETINYPCFCEYLEQYHPGVTLTLNEYIQGCFSLGFVDMCRKQLGFTDEETAFEYRYWQDYMKNHTPAPYSGIERVIRRQKEAGGIVCVVSHSSRDTITRDYETLFGVTPDAVYGWDLPPEHRKPNPWPLHDIITRYRLSPGQLLVVDDMTPGCDMARAAGVPIAFSAWGRLEYPNILAQMRGMCDFSFDSPGELEKFLFE